MTEEVYVIIRACLELKQVELSDKKLKERVNEALKWLKTIDVLTLKK